MAEAFFACSVSACVYRRRAISCPRQKASFHIISRELSESRDAAQCVWQSFITLISYAHRLRSSDGASSALGMIVIAAFVAISTILPRCGCTFSGKQPAIRGLSIISSYRQRRLPLAGGLMPCIRAAVINNFADGGYDNHSVKISFNLHLSSYFRFLCNLSCRRCSLH